MVTSTKWTTETVPTSTTTMTLTITASYVMATIEYITTSTLTIFPSCSIIGHAADTISECMPDVPNT